MGAPEITKLDIDLVDDPSTNVSTLLLTDTLSLHRAGARVDIAWGDAQTSLGLGDRVIDCGHPGDTINEVIDCGAPGDAITRIFDCGGPLGDITSARVMVRRGTNAAWTASTDIIYAGEMAITTDTPFQMRFGADTTWSLTQEFVASPWTSTLATKLSGIESGATADMTGSEIVTAINTYLGSTTWQGGGGGGGSAPGQASDAELSALTETNLRSYAPADLAKLGATSAALRTLTSTTPRMIAPSVLATLIASDAEMATLTTTSPSTDARLFSVAQIKSALASASVGTQSFVAQPQITSNVTQINIGFIPSTAGATLSQVLIRSLGGTGNATLYYESATGVKTAINRTSGGTAAMAISTSTPRAALVGSPAQNIIADGNLWLTIAGASGLLGVQVMVVYQ